MNKFKDQATAKKEINAAGHKGSSLRQSQNKVSNSEVCNTSAEEISLMHHTMDDVSTELKEVRECLNTLMKKEDIESFVKTAVKDILEDFNKNLDFTVAAKVEEQTKGVIKRLETLEKENAQLKKELESQKTSTEKLKKDIETCDNRSKMADSKANYNEQYSRKNNIKFMDVPVLPSENEQSLTKTICELVKQKDITLDPSKILAIHRIPGKPGHVQPVLVKLQNNSEKSKIMVKRSLFKASGTRLVDDVTIANGQLISRLFNHDDIESAWFFNESVYGKTNLGQRHKCDIHDVVFLK